MRERLEAVWWRRAPPPWPLRPLAGLYGAVADARARRQQARAERLPVPVVVVGNVAVGGTGKTPVTLALVQQLRALGRCPGVISRGYGGRGPFPQVVRPDTDPAVCGDEPLLMAGHGVPVSVAPDRHAAGRALLAAEPAVDVLVCDDGLQHYALARDLELCVIDGGRGHGNGWRLPAGPLREPATRAERCGLRLVNGGDPGPYGPGSLRFDLCPGELQSLVGSESVPLPDWAGRRIHAVAGIGHPSRFFDTLRAAGLDPVPHAFPDHHPYRPADLAFGDDLPVVMTEKDAVKCRRFADTRLWMLPVEARFGPADGERVRQCLQAALESWRFPPAT